MNIRVAQPQDADAIFKLGTGVEAFQVNENTIDFWPKDIILQVIEDEINHVLVAEDQGKIVGFIIANYNSSFHKAIIENVFVHAEYRRQGVGGKLLEELLKELKRIGCEYVCLLTDLSEKSSISFYQHHGFTQGMTCAWMDKSLGETFLKNHES